MMALALFSSARAQSFADRKGMEFLGNGKVQTILSSDMVMLDNQMRYKLANILVPPYEDREAIAALQKELVGKSVAIYAYAPATDQSPAADKFGVPYGQIVRQDDGVWAQKDLVSKGLARVYMSGVEDGAAAVPAAVDDVLAALKRAEKLARHEKIGLWQGSAHGIKSPYEAGAYTGSYQIVQGQVASVSSSKQYVFLNMTDDWQTGFSVLMPLQFPMWYRKGTPEFTPDYDVTKWKGRIVRVRGLIGSMADGKPIIKVTDKEQVDVIPQGAN